VERIEWQPGDEALALDPAGLADALASLGDLERLRTDIDRTLQETRQLAVDTQVALLASLRREREASASTGELATGPHLADGNTSLAVRTVPLAAADGAQTVERALSNYVAGKLLLETGSLAMTHKEAIHRLRSAAEAEAQVHAWKRRAGPLLTAQIEDFDPWRSLVEAYERVGKRDKLVEIRSSLREDLRDEVDRWLAGERDSVYPGESHALLIGVWDYAPPCPAGEVFPCAGNPSQPQPWPDLPGAKSDLEEIQKLLLDSGFAPSRIHVLANPPKKETITETMKALRIDPADRLLVYYAGHGATTEDQNGNPVGWMVPANAPARALPELLEILEDEGSTPAEREDARRELGELERDFREKALDMDIWRKWAGKSPRCELARHKLFVIDSCFSGLALTDVPSGYVDDECLATPISGDSVPPNIVGRYLAHPVTVLMSAGTADQRVLDVSLFRRRLIDSLRQPPTFITTQGFVTGRKLGEHLRGVIEEESFERDPDQVQIPEVERLRPSQGDWVFDPPPSARPEDTSGPTEADATPEAQFALTDVRYWYELLQSGEGAIQRYVESEPDGAFAEVAAAILEMRGGTSPEQVAAR
jgi:hypothetical protein